MGDWNKYNATKADIVNDFYDNIQHFKEKYKDSTEAAQALDEIEDLAIWWANAPTLRKD